MLATTWAGQPIILRTVRDVLNALHPSDKHRLGVPTRLEGGVTERHVSYLFGRITALLDPSPHSAANRDRYEHLRDTARDQVRLELGETAEQDVLQAAMSAAVERARTEHRAWLDAKHARLRWVLDRGLDATLPADQQHTGSYAIDGSALSTWARQNRATPRRPWLHPDPDAAWNGKPSWGQHGHTTGWFGYWLHGLVRVGEVGGADAPCLVERIELTPANADSRVAGVEVLTRMVADHEAADADAAVPDRPRRDVLADRAYTAETRRADDWIWPLWAMGFTSVHELTVHQLGHRRSTSTGAIIIDGQPHSPRLPAHLRSLTPPPVGSPRVVLDTYQKDIARRRLYALHAVGGRNPDGSWDFGCRAMALLGQLRCDLKPRSMALPHTRTTTDPGVYQPANPARLPKVCGQEKARVAREELPFWQPDLYGSAAWYTSYSRRNRIEGIFGNLKNDATQDISRGNIRVMGLAKTSLMTLMTVIATNLRLLDRWQARQAAAEAIAAAGAPEPRTRRPRRRTLLRQEAGAAIAGAQRRAADIAAHQRAGLPALT
ncbi:hypothetical protein ACGIF2_07785 [Cellulomonas sp. P22]|uniref:hypothetical protein n=1 Tax=Cellulomonas sp. P22 TaxID=3373189 RepID=UPI00378B3418